MGNWLTSQPNQRRSPALLSLLGLAWCSAPLACDKKEPPGSVETRPAPAPERRQATSSAFEDTDFDLVALSARVCAPEAPFLPNAGLERISVTIRISAKSSRPIPVQALGFRVTTQDEREFAATLAGCEPPLAVSTLVKDQQAEGAVAFDVPKQSSSLELIYEPFLLGRKPLAVRVRVPEPLRP